MSNFANEALCSAQIFAQKNSFKNDIFTDTDELENISRVIAVIKEKIDTTARGYHKVQKLFKEINKSKYELNIEIFQKKKELEKISMDLSQLKQIYNDYNLKYENIEELSIIDKQSKPIFMRELKNIEKSFINSNEDYVLILKEKVEIINQNLNEIESRRDEKDYLIALKDNAFEKLKVKENELNNCRNQLAMLLIEEKQIILNEKKIEQD
jgi:chromosome segregation ATPase